MNKTIFFIAILLVVGTIVTIYIWSSYNRYYIMTGKEGIAYQVDKKTGKTWVLRGTQKIQQEDPESLDKYNKEKELPYMEQLKITGNAGLSFGSFSGKIYNGGSWTVTLVLINVTAKENNGSVRWSRDFSEKILIEPLSTNYFSITLTGSEGITDAPWYIKKVYGYQK